MVAEEKTLTGGHFCGRCATSPAQAQKRSASLQQTAGRQSTASGPSPVCRTGEEAWQRLLLLHAVPVGLWHWFQTRRRDSASPSVPVQGQEKQAPHISSRISVSTALLRRPQQTATAPSPKGKRRVAVQPFPGSPIRYSSAVLAHSRTDADG